MESRRVRLSLLGRFDARWSDGESLELTGKKVRALVAYLAVEAGRRALLIDVTAFTGEPPTIFERYKLGTYVAELQRGPGRGVIIAGVGKPPMVHAQKFGELVARNRSAVARIFTDSNEAISWMKGRLLRTAAPAS